MRMSKQTLVLLMVIAAVAVALLVYVFTGSIKWALGVAGVCFALDLTFAPFILKKIEEMRNE